ncbi:hypothetical protein L3X38_032979 [Prunus dulcis]|uniref:Uncharacterized protein n=1 Tax=Prunus dulcis TaxID=3755 RepID=A0AAD4VG74_PRUDU|nr:hypothetical protein L3X38_032979 [Prunus dulcis]
MYHGGSMVKELGYLEGIILYHYKLHGSSDSPTLLQYDEDVIDMCALVPEFREFEIYLEHVNCDVEEFLKSQASQSSVSKVDTITKSKVEIEEINEDNPLAIIPSGVESGFENGVVTGVETGFEAGNVTEMRRHWNGLEGFFGNEFKPLKDIEEGDHINAELRAILDGEEDRELKRFIEYNSERDKHDL